MPTRLPTGSVRVILHEPSIAGTAVSVSKLRTTPAPRHPEDSQRLMDPTTSFAVRDLPSWNVTPGLKKNVCSRESGLTVHESTSLGRTS